MGWPARLVSATSVLLILSCASTAPDPPASSADHAVPARPPDVQVEVEEPPPAAAAPVHWRLPRPRLQVHVRAPEAAVRERSRTRRTASGRIERSRERLVGAWSFVHGETIGMAIFESSGRIVLQALGGQRVTLGFRVLRAPEEEPGRLQLRPVPDSTASDSSGPAAGAAGEGHERFRALFKWRGVGRVDLQVPRAGEEWPREFGRDRYRLFKNVEDAVRFLERREHQRLEAPATRRAD